MDGVTVDLLQILELVVFGILAAHEALSAPAIQAQARVRALQATYVLDCPAHRLDEGAGSLADLLRAGPTPTWLERLSPITAPIFSAPSANVSTIVPVRLALVTARCVIAADCAT